MMSESLSLVEKSSNYPSPRPSSHPPDVSAPHGVARIVGESPVTKELRERVVRVGAFPGMSVLISGETGTGKEVVAHAIHEVSASSGPMVSLNCAAIPEALFESELFGHGAGAFTSAKGARAGLMEEAGNGTLFLDEVGELPPSLQAKLLRVLETRRYRRVGSNQELRFHARVVAATNRDLASSGALFRSDLYYRIAGYTITTPPLRDRPLDIIPLARKFLAEFRMRYGGLHRFTSEAEELLTRFSFPGNIRQLRSIVENAAVYAGTGVVDVHAVERLIDDSLGPRSATFRVEPPESTARPLVGKNGRFKSFADLERYVIEDAFDQAQGNLSRASDALGIPRTTLRDRLRRYGRQTKE